MTVLLLFIGVIGIVTIVDLIGAIFLSQELDEDEDDCEFFFSKDCF